VTTVSALLSRTQAGSNGCLIWQRATNSRGYGVVWHDGKVRLAHRVMWNLTYGAWPTPGLVIDHVCEVKPCVNPGHLRESTNRDNVLRSPFSPMNTIKASPACRNGHTYPIPTRIDSNGWRVCPSCPSRRGRFQ